MTMVLIVPVVALIGAGLLAYHLAAWQMRAQSDLQNVCGVRCATGTVGQIVGAFGDRGELA